MTVKIAWKKKRQFVQRMLQEQQNECEAMGLRNLIKKLLSDQKLRNASSPKALRHIDVTWHSNIPDGNGWLLSNKTSEDFLIWQDYHRWIIDVIWRTKALTRKILYTLIWVREFQQGLLVENELEDPFPLNDPLRKIKYSQVLLRSLLDGLYNDWIANAPVTGNPHPPHPGETWGIRQLKGKKEEKVPP